MTAKASTRIILYCHVSKKNFYKNCKLHYFFDVLRNRNLNTNGSYIGSKKGEFRQHKHAVEVFSIKYDRSLIIYTVIQRLTTKPSDHVEYSKS